MTYQLLLAASTSIIWAIIPNDALTQDAPPQRQNIQIDFDAAAIAYSKDVEAVGSFRNEVRADTISNLESVALPVLLLADAEVRSSAGLSRLEIQGRNMRTY